APATVPQAEGRARRDVEQRRVLGAALDARVRPRERGLVAVRQALGAVAVLLVVDLVLRARPQCARLVHRLPFVGGAHLLRFGVPLLLAHADRQRDVVRIAAHDRLQLPRREQVLEARLVELGLAGHFARRRGTQVQRDVGAARRLLHRLHRELAGAFGLPAHRLVGGQPRAARDDDDAVGDDERRIEADAELADQLRVARLVAGELAEELARARARDRA